MLRVMHAHPTDVTVLFFYIFPFSCPCRSFDSSSARASADPVNHPVQTNRVAATPTSIYEKEPPAIQLHIQHTIRVS